MNDFLANCLLPLQHFGIIALAVATCSFLLISAFMQAFVKRSSLNTSATLEEPPPFTLFTVLMGILTIGLAVGVTFIITPLVYHFF